MTTITHTIVRVDYAPPSPDVSVTVARTVDGIAFPPSITVVALKGLNTNPAFTDADTIAAYSAAAQVPSTDTVQVGAV